MKVIDGNFGEGPEMDALDRLQDQLKRAELADNKDGQYLVIWDMGDALVLLSNMENAGDVYLQCAKAQTAIMATQFDEA